MLGSGGSLMCLEVSLTGFIAVGSSKSFTAKKSLLGHLATINNSDEVAGP